MGQRGNKTLSFPSSFRGFRKKMLHKDTILFLYVMCHDFMKVTALLNKECFNEENGQKVGISLPSVVLRK